MICVVLAAGYATRLYPLTKQFPKPLLPVKGKPILDWLLYDIDRTDSVSSYVIISNHKFYQQFEDWKASCTLKRPVTILDDGSESNETRLGAVRDIAFAVDRLNLKDDLLVIAGDNVLDFSFRPFIDYFHQKKASCIMRYFEPERSVLQACGVVQIEEDGLVTSMVEKPEVPATHWAVPPFYLYRREDIPLIAKGIASGCGVDAPGSFVAWLCRQSKVYAMEMQGKRYDIGDLKSYEQVKETYRGIL